MALAWARAGRMLAERKGQPMTMPYAEGDVPLIPRPELTLPALRQAVAAVTPSRLPEFFEDLQNAFVRAGDEDSVVPIRVFYRQWAVVVEIEPPFDCMMRTWAPGGRPPSNCPR